jgi:[NiFe] hydrogenase assembly HybE family chaperone
MTENSDLIALLQEHFEEIRVTHMRGLPILNPHMAVEVVAVRDFGEHRMCVLITPWFMNLVLLPGNEEWSGVEQGESVSIELPRESLDFMVSHDDAIATFLSVVLFRTVTDFPDQDTAREVARQVMHELFTSDKKTARKTVNRRALLTGLGTN